MNPSLRASTTLLAGLLMLTALTEAASSANSKATTDITIVRSDSRSLVFEFRPAYFSTRSVGGKGSTFTLYTFAGASQINPPSAAGQVDLPCRRFAVSLPSLQGNRVQVLSAEYKDLQPSTVAPVPQRRIEKGMFGDPQYLPDNKAYSVSKYLPGDVVTLSTPSQVRSLLVATVTIAPVQFNPATRSVRRYVRLVIEVTYGGTGTLQNTGTDAKLLGPGLLNGAVMGSMRAVRRTAELTPSVLNSGKWYRLTVNADDIYKLDGTYLSAAGIDVASVDPRTIRIYGNGGSEVPEDITQPRPTDLVEIAISVRGESDGKFDTGDYILFYGKSVRGWTYDHQAQTLRHSINHYSEVNYYWLTYGGGPGKRMAIEQSDPDPATYTPDRFRDAIAVEEENVKLLNPDENVLSGKDWYAHILDDKSPTFTYMKALPGLVPGDQITYRFTLLAYPPDGGASFDVLESGTSLGRFIVSGPPSPYLHATSKTSQITATSNLSAGQSRLAFSFSLASAGSQGYVDWVEWHYPRFFFSVGNYLHFWGPDMNAVVEYQLQQFTEEPMIFDVTSPSDIKLIGGVYGTYAFRAPASQGSIQEFVAAAPSSWKQPVAIQSVQNQNLRGYADGADYIILTSPEFRSAADRLAAWRQDPAHGGMNTIVVDVNQIYNEFSSGVPDISAIRDYLYYAYTNWTRKPQFVLFFGGASYDYKGILGKKSTYVPTWESPNSVDGVASYSTDDFFVKFGTGENPWMVTGRIPTRDPQDANVVVDKIERYETQSARDGWKMRIAFVADDAWTAENGEIGDRTEHSDDAELLSSTGYTPDQFEKRKIYIAEYPTVYDALGRRKPGAFEAIIDQINQGSLIVNYTGHGNPQQWAHENIFNSLTSIPRLVNANRLSLFFLATCNFSQYDDPSQVSGGELLVNKAEGGGIAVIAACRKVYAGGNAYLNQKTFKELLRRDTLGRVIVERPATALFRFKQTTTGSNDHNDQKYFFLGDPTLRLQYPSGYASIDSVNGLPVDSATVAAPIVMKSLSTVTVSGDVRNEANNVDGNFNGQMTLLVNDASRVQTIVNFYPGVNWSYVATGSTIFRGDNTVSNGRFHATFVVPKDVFFGDSTGRGRVVAYCRSSDADAEGYTGDVAFRGTGATGSSDKSGPAVTIFLNNRSYKEGDLVGPNPVLILDLSDSNGINTSASGIGHRIEAWLNSSSQSIDLTDAYAGNVDNFRRGSVQYQLTGLPGGKNTLRVRAWDSFNNSNTAVTEFQVAADQDLVIRDVMNFPNPFSSGTTWFTFHQNQTSPLNVRIKVYTVAGRLIKTIEATTGGESFVRVPWDGRDEDGDGIANGVYLYKVIASTVDGRFSNEALGKLAHVR